MIVLALWVPNVTLALESKEEKIKAYEAMFPQGEPSEEDVYRADRLLSVATKRSVPLRKAPAIATVIYGEEIREMGARNFMDVLKLIPGFGVAINEHGVNMIEVRGVQTTLSEKILLMIDGHAVNKNYVGSALAYMYDDITIENIQQVEIVRGPGSALYGSNAFLAVINVITKKAVNIDGAEITASYGSFDTSKVNIMGGKFFKNGIQLSGNYNYSKTNGANLEIAQDRLSGTPFSLTPGNAETQSEKSDLFMEILYNNLSFRGEYMTRGRGTFIGFNYALTNDDNWGDLTTYWGEIDYNYEFSKKIASSIRVYYDYFEQDAEIILMPAGLPGYPNGLIGAPKLKDRTFGSEIQIDYDPFARNHLIAGFLYENTNQYDVKHITNFNPLTGAPLGGMRDISSWGNFNKDVDREIYAVYMQDEWNLLDNLNLTAGVRYDDYSDFGDAVSPRVGVVWGITEQSDLKFLYGEAFRVPNFVELYNDNNPVIMGNPNLKPEEIKTYEISAAHTFNSLVETKINYFYNKIDELIIWDTSTSPARYANKGGAEIDGVEFVFNLQPSTFDYLRISYVYQDPRDAATNDRLPNIPRQRATVSANYSLSNYFLVHTDILWTDTRPRASGDTRPEMPAYTIVNLALTAKNFYKGLDVQGAIHNLFDQYYSDPDTSGSLQLIPNDFPREGFSATVTVRYAF